MKWNLLAALCVALTGISSASAGDCCDQAGSACCDSQCGAANCCDTSCDACCDTGCDQCCDDACGDCCDDCDIDSCCGCEPCGLVAGVEATFLRPDFEGDSFLFEYDAFEAAPRVWAGFENCRGWGVRGRYWQLDSDDRSELVDLIDFGFGGALIDLEADSRFDVYTADVELTHRVQYGCNCEVLGTVGARHAKFERENSFDLLVGGQFGNDPFSFYLDDDWRREFEGTGITGALEGRHRIGRSNFSVVWSARGSYLWGELTTELDVVGLITVSDDFAQPIFEDRFDAEDLEVFIGEAQAGLEWSRPIECICGTVFTRVMAEYQHWDIDSENDSIIFNSGATEVDFFGGTITVGFNR